VTSTLIKANFKLLKGETPTNLTIHRKLSDAIVSKKGTEAHKAMKELLIKNKKDLKRILSIQSKYL
jgi:DNA-binding FadR family transcriptional regulator